MEQFVPEGARSLIQAIIENNSFTLGLMEGDSARPRPIRRYAFPHQSGNRVRQSSYGS